MGTHWIVLNTTWVIESSHLFMWAFMCLYVVLTTCQALGIPQGTRNPVVGRR